MINCEEFYKILKENGLTFFTGVPDSLLKEFCAYLSDNSNNIIAANEGNSISIALGYHLATGKIGVVYMQNAGLGNTINPLVSLVHQEVYSIPILLIIGWRGEPGKKDEPQHIAQGKITLNLLDIIGIKYKILPRNIEEAKKIIYYATNYMKSNNAPYAIVIRKGTFSQSGREDKSKSKFNVTREDALKIIVPLLEKQDIIVSTTGMLSRELYELREVRNESHSNDFLTVGGMGHASSIALGIAIQKPKKNVYCFDGDGALIMHMGSLSTIGILNPKKFKHVIFNNFSHDSVGGFPTASSNINIRYLAIANGYHNVFSSENAEQIKKQFVNLKNATGLSILIINIKKGVRKDLGRPTTSPIQNKKAFMEFLNNETS